jgi:hypothetical protein
MARSPLLIFFFWALRATAFLLLAYASVCGLVVAKTKAEIQKQKNFVLL